MPAYRILKEQAVPEERRKKDDLATRSEFADTGDVMEFDDPSDAQTHVERLQAKHGGCYAAEQTK